MARVRGTMKEVPGIEVNVDTVYIRTNIRKIEEESFVGWEYDEIQYNKDEFIGLISTENEELKNKNLTLEADQISTLEAIVELYEMILGGTI